MGKTLMATALVGVLLAGCSAADPTDSAQYAALEQQLEAAIAEQGAITASAEYVALSQRLDEVKAERDALASDAATAAARYDKTKATVDAVTELLADPDGFGTQSEFLDRLMVYYAPDAVMDDVAFGAEEMRQAWTNTLLGDADAEIHTWHTWISDDGSSGGSLWTWKGTNRSGEAFELIGINISSYDDEGLETYQLVTWPYPYEYVRRTFLG
jgi:hypothetical protein